MLTPHGEAGVVAMFMGQMLAGEQVVINGDGEQVRDFVYVGECARANLLAITAAPDHVIYNLGSSRGTSVNEIYRTLQTICGYDRDPVFGPVKLGETRRIYLDTSRARRELGWEPMTTLDEGLTQTVEHFRAVGQVP